MPAANLHDDGWCQGSLIRAMLSVRVLDQVGDTVQEKIEQHELWLLTAQDCDLAQTKVSNGTRNFELRPVYPIKADDKVDGIRTRVIKITEELVLRADCPRLVLTAKALTILKDKRENALDSERRRDVKTWLGLRYDRPAVPTRFEKVNAALEKVFSEAFPDNLKGQIRDVLVYYHSETEINLFVITRKTADKNAIVDWLDGVADGLDNITTRARYVEDSSRTPLSVLETYYSLFASENSLSAEGQDLP